ncbi:MAG: acetylglutamate kinase [Phototrophicales bacterium]|nr:MAG: acetylglutamate kinase [Phototrophicales bacterium]RMG70724.1 MAG: [LysW]-aminoadipate kinase [Chloroflexota bacterium]
MNTLVVKLGGGEGLNLPRACADLAQINRPLVVVHGVSARMQQLCEERGIAVQMLTSPSGHSSRYTTPQIRDIFVEAAQQVNREIVELLWSYNLSAIGLTDVIYGERKTTIRAVINGRVRVIRDDYSGSIINVDAERISQLLREGYVPVITPMAISADGYLNIDGDRASAAVASALNAEELLILSNVPGLLRDFSDPNSLITQIPATQIDEAMHWAQGRMKRKVLGAQEALAGGVSRVIIGDGRVDHPITQALNGMGTVFVS